MLLRLITRLVGWAVAIFYDVERTGPTLPAGPVLVTANHPNALVDPLVIFRTVARETRPLAKAPLFDQALVGTVLKGLGGLPVYRREDDPTLMHRNERTFDAAIAALHRGEAVQIYPEGQSHSEPALAQLRTGAARIALQAEARRHWTLGLQIQPVGLTYSKKHLFRGRVVAAFGPPFPVDGYREAFEADPRLAARQLTGRIREGLEALTLNLENPSEVELVEVAERLYSRQKRLAGWRERVPLADRLPRMQQFARGLGWLRVTDPEGFQRLSRAVRRYRRYLAVFGARDGDVPPGYRPLDVARYILVQTLFLLLVLPLAAVGMLFWLPPFVVTRYVAPLFRPTLDQVATYKLGTAILVFPAWLALLAAGAWLLLGLRWMVVSLTVFPAVGLAAIAWHERQARLWEDFRVWVKVLRHPGDRDRLAEQRRWLVAEFDRLRDLRTVDGEGGQGHDRSEVGGAEAPS
ncbi:MAG: 1-acyl-sn-glycerol-3-phosphate acyltransferase [Gemmatimonadota bacterium]